MKKAKKFALGGETGMSVTPTPKGVNPLEGIPAIPGFPRGVGVSPAGGGGAFGGLQRVDEGGKQIGDSLMTIQQGLGGPAGGGGYEKPMPMFKKGGAVGSASKRADGCATKGKTKGRMV